MTREQQLEVALIEVMTWISNWTPNFVLDDEWPQTEAKVTAVLPNKHHGRITMQKSPNVIEEILIDNDDVTVTRVTIPQGATQHPDQPRDKRVIVAVTPVHIERQVKQADPAARIQPEVSHRVAGDAVFHDASHHSITNLGDEDHVSVIVELKH